jgi:hypothetical protein
MNFFFKVNNMKYWHPHLPLGQHISVSTLVWVYKNERQQFFLHRYSIKCTVWIKFFDKFVRVLMTVSTVFCQTNFRVNCGNRNRRTSDWWCGLHIRENILSKRRWCGNIGRNVHLWTLRWWCSEIFIKRCTLYMHMMSMEFEKIHPWLENSNSNKTANVSMRKVNPNSDSPPCNGYGELGNYVTRYCHHIHWW